MAGIKHVVGGDQQYGWACESCAFYTKDVSEAAAHERRIRTNHDYPPIPLRQFDWSAWVDGEEESGPIGRGRTEQAAINDLTEQIAEKSEAGGRGVTQGG